MLFWDCLLAAAYRCLIPTLSYQIGFAVLKVEGVCRKSAVQFIFYFVFIFFDTAIVLAKPIWMKLF